MAFEGEYGEYQPEGKPRDGPITTWDTNPLFTFFALFASGFLLLIEWGIALIALPYILQFMPPTGPPDPIGIVVMMLFVPVGALQVYLAYRLYKRTPNTLNVAFFSAVLVIIMSVTIIITGFLTGTSTDPTLPAIQIGVNGILAYLSRLYDVKEHFGDSSSFQQF